MLSGLVSSLCLPPYMDYSSSLRPSQPLRRAVLYQQFKTRSDNSAQVVRKHHEIHDRVAARSVTSSSSVRSSRSLGCLEAMQMTWLELWVVDCSTAMNQMEAVTATQARTFTVRQGQRSTWICGLYLPQPKAKETSSRSTRAVVTPHLEEPPVSATTPLPVAVTNTVAHHGPPLP